MKRRDLRTDYYSFYRTPDGEVHCASCWKVVSKLSHEQLKRHFDKETDKDTEESGQTFGN